VPEGPELAYSRDRIKSLIEGKALCELRIGSTGRFIKKPPEGLGEFIAEKNLKGSPRVKEVGTKGKFMWWMFEFPSSAENWYLHCTYGMSGGWYTSPSKHTAFIIEYNGSGVSITRDTQKLFFNDARRFGTLKFLKGDTFHKKKLASLGPCILTSELTPELFVEKILKKPNRTISESLMDQSVVSGIGNYLKAEVLFKSRISPWRTVTEITSEEYIDLLNNSIEIANSSYVSQGATISTYRTVDGSKGTTQFNFQIYSKQNCSAGHEVRREDTPDGRTSWWCPICQK